MSDNAAERLAHNAMIAAAEKIQSEYGLFIRTASFNWTMQMDGKGQVMSVSMDMFSVAPMKADDAAKMN